MKSLIADIKKGSFKSLARLISLVENEADDYEVYLQQLPIKKKCCHNWYNRRTGFR